MDLFSGPRHFEEDNATITTRCLPIAKDGSNSWGIFNPNSDNVDMEVLREVEYLGAPELADDYTLHLQITFVDEERRFYFVLGENFGEGFEPGTPEDVDFPDFDAFFDALFAQPHENSEYGFRRTVKANKELVRGMFEEAGEMLESLNLTWKSS
ncbi:hypothetical protein [Neptuniibacter sp. QD37_11]|uniref:hypothetical protein n=1 Tax=Neptuniibacter sp. QD37_11 TaxID=3398209 RepID=UPI0039F44B19